MAFPYGDFIMIDNDISPGIARVSPPTYPLNYDVTEGFGASGASMRFKGRGLGTFEVAFEFADDSLKEEMDRFCQAHFEVPLGKRPDPIQFYHPITVSPPHRITAVVVTDVKGWEQIGNGLWVVRVSFQEYRALKAFPVSKAKDPVPEASAADAAPITKADKILAAAYAANQAAQARYNVPIGSR